MIDEKVRENPLGSSQNALPQLSESIPKQTSKVFTERPFLYSMTDICRFNNFEQFLQVVESCLVYPIASISAVFEDKQEEKEGM